MAYSFSMYYSTAAAATTSHSNLLVEILMNSLGFSTEKVISTSAKVTFLKPGNNKPLLVVNFFQQIGLDISHIRTLVCTNPSLLFSDVEKILKPKTKLLQELGLSGSDIAKVISKSSEDSVAKVIKRGLRILWRNAPKVMSPNIAFLRNFGFSGKDIEKRIVRDPKLLHQKMGWLENAVHRVEKNLHIPRDSNIFFYGFIKIPLCLTLSEARLGKGLNIFMKDLRYGAGYLASHLALLAHNLEKRVMPRYEILKLLGKKKLSRGSLNLYTAVILHIA
uniref:Transcription termination factor MTERF6, chloroplastic/mitochondrial-like n=1 Tax=Nicotiana tabacum TaxID=4097 RepID=A0A1S4DJ96_TOBAC|nr:PREDICTED: uncharacterized protein LOC107830411 [Nicotiana tabacum]